jgi:hypothetical protein
MPALERWIRNSPLAAGPACTKAEIVGNWERGPEWYFIADPADR